jgi:uncharacterized protein YwgA
MNMANISLNKEHVQKLIQLQHDEAVQAGKSLYMVTLHPAYRYANNKSWRVPCDNNGLLVLEGFVGLMNSFLRNCRSNTNYVKGIAAVEYNEMGEQHLHLVIEQTIADQQSFEKKLNKLAQLVNNKEYFLKVKDKPHVNVQGLGYENKNGQFMRYDLIQDVAGISGYLTKFGNTKYLLLSSRGVDHEYYGLINSGKVQKFNERMSYYRKAA